MPTAAHLLTGKELQDGWRVIKKIERTPGLDTGGCFSVSYIIEHRSGRRAFLKAVDFACALGADDPARMMEEVTSQFNFERNILAICTERRMSRVVIPLAEGKIQVEGAEGPNLTQYLIFDLADGDLRRHLMRVEEYEVAWKLHALHNIAVGLSQLHTARIAHQDLKPSNVLVYGQQGSKVADLGRSICERVEAPHGECIVAGDQAYAPPELLYSLVHEDPTIRRYGCDAYLMGSMVYFVFVGFPLTPAIFQNVRDEHLPRNWHDGYMALLPHIRDAFGFALDHLRDRLPDRFRERILEVVRELCDPDPNLRGDPLMRARRANPFSMERYISRLNLWARDAEVHARFSV